ncbi:MAG: MBL fold metallo-hydrolase [Chlamydiales bacterium]
MRRGLLGDFLNPHQRKICRGFFHFLLWQIGYYNDPYPAQPAPEGFVYPNPIHDIDESAPTVTWVNHSTFWVAIGGKSFLFDPIWCDRCSPFDFIGPKRRHLPGVTLDALKNIDFVVISHNHYDHLDRAAIRQLYTLYPHIYWIVPKGVRKWFLRNIDNIDRTRIYELDWWERVEIRGVAFTSTPSQHFSGRGVLDRNRSLWMGCVIETKAKRFYFVGDTGYNEVDFKEVGEELGEMDLSIIPIGVYAPRRFMRAVHINPFESVQIHKDVRSKLSVGGHFGTFRLSSEEMSRPPYDLFLACQEAELPPHSFRVLQPGQRINW